MTEYPHIWLTNLSRYIADLNTELVKTKAENAELRKLLRQVVEHVHEEHLPHEDISFWSDRDNGVFRRMRELGIEVSEWA